MPEEGPQSGDDGAAKALRFMLVKAAIFMGIPLAAAAIAAAVIVMR